MIKIDIKNIYEADFAYDYINNRYTCEDYCLYKIYVPEVHDLLSHEPTDYKNEIENYKTKVEEYLYSYSNNDGELKDIISRINKAIKQERVNKTDLDWIEIDNKRLCNWIWCLLHGRSFIDFLNKNRLDNFVFISSAMNFKERYNDLVNFFLESSYSKSSKLELISKLKKEWTDVVKDRRIENLLNISNIEQSVWAFKYIENNYKEKLSRTCFYVNSEIDYYYIVNSYFDLIKNNYEKSNKIDLLKKAWSQKKYRDSNNGKKPYNFNMSVSIADKLTRMSEGLNTNKNLLVEQLIEKKYKEFINGQTN